MKQRLKRTAAALLALGCLCAASPVKVYADFDHTEFEASYTYPAQMRELSAIQLVNDMGAGWNLGNSLDCNTPYEETGWGNPRTTKDMIDAIADAGIKTLRIPVSWDGHYSDAASHTINPVFMDRVETVVNYALANDMYVILNTHHMRYQETVTTSRNTAVEQEIADVWTQIAENFKGYGDKLIFEITNEPRNGDSFWLPDSSSSSGYYNTVYYMNEAGRQAVRATGGNNSKRLIMLSNYAATGTPHMMAQWRKPADDMVAVSVHAYLPYDFALNAGGTTVFGAAEKSALDSFFSSLDSLYISKGIPVVIGEFGATNKGNDAQRLSWFKYYMEKANSNPAVSVPCVLWDNNSFEVGGEQFGYFNRSAKSFTSAGASFVDVMAGSYNSVPEPEAEAAGGNVELVSSPVSSGGEWSLICKLSKADVISNMEKYGTMYVEFSGCSKQPRLNADIEGWPHVREGVANSTGTATYTLSDVTGISGIDSAQELVLMSEDSATTVAKVYFKSDAPGHVHSYTGTSEILLEPTATTSGRKITCCSEPGCNEYKIELIPATGGNELPVLVFCDVNGDGNVDILDLNELSRVIMKVKSKVSGYNYDVNDDGQIDIKDVLAVRKKIR